MKKKHRNFRDFQELILDSLKDPEYEIEYLKAALADEDERVFLLALRDVLQARGETIGDLAQETNLNRQNLYRMLSLKGNPRLASLKAVLQAIGFEMDIRPIKK